jgi:predicted  nucleic acid-binding Zn-ribbon protein
MAEADADVRIHISAVDKASEVFKKVVTGLRETGTGLDSLAAEAKGLAEGLKPLGQALTAAGAAGTALATSSVMTAARTEELGLVLGVMAENARDAAMAEGDFSRANEMATANVWRAVEAIKEKGISTQVASKLASQFIRYELDMAQATELARVAQDAAVISMQDSSEALDGLLHGILTYNPRVLRTYGITVLAADAFEQFAEANGIAVDEMDNSQRAQAMLNSVLVEGERITGAYEAAMGSAGKQLRSFTGRELQELRNALGQAFLPLMGSAVGTVRDLTQRFLDLDPASQRAVSGILGVASAGATLTGATILLTPRLVETYKALRLLATFGGDTFAAATLVAKGFSVAEVASLGLAGAVGALALPVSIAAVGLGGVYTLIRKYPPPVELAEQSMEGLAEASAVLEGRTYEANVELARTPARMGDLQRASSDLMRQQQALSGEVARWSEHQRRMRQVAEDSEAAIRNLAAEMGALQAGLAGPIREENARYEDEQRRIQEEMAEVNEELEELYRRHGAATGSQEELTIAQYSAQEATRKLSEAQEALAANTDPEKQLELEAAVARATIKLNDANDALGRAGSGFADYSEAIGEAEGHLGDLEQQARDLEAAHGEAMRSIIMDMIMTKIATGEFGAAGQQVAMDIALSMGLIDQATYDAAMGIDAAFQGLLEGESIPDTEAALWRVFDAAEAIPRDISINVRWKIYGTSPVAGGHRETRADQSRQAGGPVMADRAYLVHRDEVIVPAQPGYVLSRSDVMEALRGGRGGGNTFYVTIHSAAPTDRVVDDLRFAEMMA